MSRYSHKDQLNLSRLLNIVIEKAWLIFLCLAVSLLVGQLYLANSIPIYQAEVVLEVESKEQKIINIQNSIPEELKNETLRTIEQNLKNRTLFLNVLKENKLLQDPQFLPDLKNSLSLNQAVDALSNMVTIHLRRGTRLINLSIEHSNPEMAEKLANLLVNEFIEQNANQRADSTEKAVHFLHKEVQKQREKLEQSDQVLQKYREATHTVSLQEHQNIVIEKLKDLNSKWTETKSESLKLYTDHLQAQKAGLDLENLLSIPSIANDQAIIDIRKQIAQQQTEIIHLTQRYKPKYPKMIQAQNHLLGTQKLLQEAAFKALEVVEINYQKAVETEKSFQEALAEQEKLSFELDQKAIRYHALKEEFEVNRVLYETVLKQLKETEISRGIEPSIVRVIQVAMKPENPIKPKRISIFILSMVGGIILGLSLAFSSHALNTAVKTVDQAEEILKLPVLGAIPVDEKGFLCWRRRSLPMFERPASEVSEAFRSMRTALSLVDSHSQNKTILFTSAIPSEGKSFCCANYAIALAQQGKKTLLIDADLRRPSLAKMFGMKHSQKGTIDYLCEKSVLQDLIIPLHHDQLWLITTGSQLSFPSESLSRGRFEQLLQDALNEFECVIIDSAPILSVSDTLLMVPHVHFTYLVVEAGKTASKAILRSIELLKRAHAPLVGIILNRLPKRCGLSYYYHYAVTGRYELAYQGSERTGG